MAHIDACIYGRKVRKIFEVKLKPIREKYDVKMIEVEILLYFCENSGKTASDLHRDLGLNKGQVSVGLDNLCKKKMLKAYTNSEDRRYLQYEILDAGEVVVKDVKEEVCSIYNVMTVGVSAEQQKEFFDIGLKICDNIDKCF